MAGNVAPLGSMHHNGIGHAGNKSFTSYRVGHSVPGYTGYIPAHEAVPIPVKRGVAEHTGRLRGAYSSHGDGAPTVRPKTEHGCSFALKPEDVGPMAFSGRFLGTEPRFVGNSPFVIQQSVGQKKFIGQSTYTAELEAKEKKLDTRDGIHIAGTVRPGGGNNASPFFQSEYMQKASESQLGNAHSKPSSAPMKVPLGSGTDAATAAAAVNLRPPAINSMYRANYGAIGQNPKDNNPNASTEICERASTLELNAGTSKGSKHMPGYAGTIPASGVNPAAMEHGAGKAARKGTKDFRLSTLYQMPMNVPGYGGYRSTSVVNASDPVRDPNLTSSGRAGSASTNGFEAGQLGLSLDARSRTAPYKSQAGIVNAMHHDFFQHAAMSVSDNGVAESETFFGKYRPFEGRSVAIVKQGHWNQY